MHLTANLLLLAALLFALGAGGYGCLALFTGRKNTLDFLEKANLAIAGLITIASIILTIALVNRDYSFKYVYDHVDNLLPLFYTITGFWAGAEGSLLFWILSISVMGVIFARLPGFRQYSSETRLYYWVFFMVIQAFFLLILTNWSNPFLELVPIPSNGRGLNPLLRNPGMIFHPPLLFLGYAGFTSPAAIALASFISGEDRSWVKICRNWNITAWIFLTAGIILGGWWSYMELGWGGYWAWDPVENASLIPWLSATAFMHTSVIESRRNALGRTNIFLMSLTFMLSIFATYLVRSGVIQSLHAFGEGGVGLPLCIFMLGGIAVVAYVILIGSKKDTRMLSGLGSRQGMLVVAAWVLIALGLVVGLGTMWPVISKMWASSPVGLDAKFYNRVCLPLFSLLILIFAICPWLDWKEGIHDKRGLSIVFVAFLAALGINYAAGLHNILALVTASAAIASLVGIVALFVFKPQMRRVSSTIGVYGIHIGLALVFLGIAWSGPNQTTVEAVLKKGESTQVGTYTLTYLRSNESQNMAMASVMAVLEVKENGKQVGILAPERRIYSGYPQPFAEVSVLPGLIDELYGVLLSYQPDGTATIKVSVNPLINWMWIGGTLMCLFGFIAFRKTVIKPEE
jgi:cytochrome c-type biogenesis protein CcmF